MLNKTLARQLNKHFGSEEKIPVELKQLFQTISDTYRHADEDRRLIERSLDISSRELGDLNLALQSERDRARAIILSIVDGLVVVKKDYTIDLINPQAERMLDLTTGIAGGVKLFDIAKFIIDDKLISPEEGFVARTMRTTEVLSSTLENDFFLQTRTGKKLPIVLTTMPLMLSGTNEVYGVVIIFRDVTKEKQQHDLIESEVAKRTQELSAERNKISLTLASVTDAVITLDLEGHILIFNKAAEILLNKFSKDVMGEKIEDVIRVYDNDVEITKDTYAPANADNAEAIVFNKNSLKIVCGEKEVYVIFICGHITDGRKVNIGSIITLHDISKEKQLEEMKIDFVSMAAHELRTPLTSIRGYASLLQKQLAGKLTDDQQKFMNIMLICIENLANLINNLLSVSRIERNSMRLDLAVIDLAGITQSIVDELKNAAQTRNQTLTFIKEQEQFPSVVADNFRIGEVLRNLIGNAIAYTKSGGNITVRLTQKDNTLSVSIADTGEGIPKEALPRLFSKFFRVSGVLGQGSKGTGLGLYISKSIINMHRGTIGVESEFGKGSVFHFLLPIATENEKVLYSNSHPSTDKFGIIINRERQKRYIKNP